MTFDINHLDQLIQTAYNPEEKTPQQQQEAQNQLYEIQQRDDLWMYADQILDSELSYKTKFFASTVLRNLVSSKWDMLNDETREGIKNFIISHICTWAGIDGFYEPLLNETDHILALIIAKEWPQNWPNVMDELLDATLNSTQAICKNNLNIITLVSEQVMTFGENELTSTRISQLSNALTQISPNIYSLIESVLTGTDNSDIIKVGLNTLKAIVKWLDPHFIFETELPKALCDSFLPNPLYQKYVLSFFGEVASLPKVPEQYIQIFPNIFAAVIGSLKTLIKEETNFAKLCLDDPEFIRIFVFTISAFVSQYSPIIESANQFEALAFALNCIIEIMKVCDLDNFRTICELWEKITRRIYVEKPNNAIPFYTNFFPIVRRVLVVRMERPVEILITESDDGSYVKEETRNTITLALYNSMRKTLIYLANIDTTDTMNAIIERINILKESFNIDVLNTMCWSAGAISGTLPNADEAQFIVTVLKPLLEFIASRTNEQEQTVLASCIMFVCSQYPKFLSEHWNIMQIIIEKLFEFMKNENEGIMEMAVNSFKKIAQKCSKSFLFYRTNNNIIYLQSILQNLDNITSCLSLNLIVNIFDSLSIIIASEKNEEQKVTYTSMLMERLNERWTQSIQQFNNENKDILKSILFILRCNDVVANNIEVSYQLQLQIIFEQALQLYGQCSIRLGEMISKYGESAQLHEIFRIVKEIKSSILNIYITFIRCSKNISMIQNQILPQVLPIINDFPASHPFCRSQQVIILISTITEKVKEAISPNIPQYIETIFLPAVEMIKNNYEDFIEFRIPIANFLKQIFINVPSSILSLNVEQIQVIEGVIEWGAEHPNQNICIEYLELILTLIQMVENIGNQQFKTFFYNSFYDSIFVKTFTNMTDTIHKFGFSQQVNIFQKLLSLKIEQNNPERIASLIYSQFPNRELQFYNLVFTRLYQYSNNQNAFRSLMRDLLIEVRQYSSKDPDLFIVEKQQEEARIAEENKQIPGLVEN